MVSRSSWGWARVTLVTRAVVVVIVYLGVVISPRFTGLAMMGLEFALVARLRAVAVPFDQDALLHFHRQIGYVVLVFILTHFAISAQS